MSAFFFINEHIIANAYFQMHHLWKRALPCYSLKEQTSGQRFVRCPQELEPGTTDSVLTANLITVHSALRECGEGNGRTVWRLIDGCLFNNAHAYFLQELRR